jgi:hypothetical protein
MLGSLGCAGGSEKTGEPDPSQSAESSRVPSANSETSESVADPEARKALRSGFIRLAQANTGRYEVEIPFGSEARIHERGEYRIRPLAFKTVRVQSSPEGSMTMAVVGVGNDRWIRLESVTNEDGNTQSWPCWVNYDDVANAATAADFPIDLDAGPDGQAPSAVVAASWGIGTEIITPESIGGTIDLTLTLGLLGARAIAAAGIDTQADSTVPASFSLDQRVLSGFTVRLADLPEAIEAAGGEMDPGLSGLSQAPGAIEAHFSAIGAPIDVQAPPAEERVKFRNDLDFEPAMRACGND